MHNFVYYLTLEVIGPNAHEMEAGLQEARDMDQVMLWCGVVWCAEVCCGVCGWIGRGKSRGESDGEGEEGEREREREG